MEILSIIFIVIVFAIATIIVNSAYQFFMKLIGSDVMYFSIKKKLFAITMVAMILGGMILKLFGYE